MKEIVFIKIAIQMDDDKYTALSQQQLKDIADAVHASGIEKVGLPLGNQLLAKIPLARGQAQVGIMIAEGSDFVKT